MTADIKKAFDCIQQAEKAVHEAYNLGFKDGLNSDQYLNYRKVAYELSLLESQVKSFRETAIRAAIQSGEKTKDIAESYGITSARVSQIAPRKSVSKEDSFG